jgi:hypothetical protein
MKKPLVAMFMVALILTAMAAAGISLFAGSTKFYYHFPISAFAKVEVASDENHPDYGWAECKDNRLYAKSSRTYGTARDEITLDLATGEISGASEFSGPDTRDNFVIRAPDQGGDYFKYLDKLAVMENIFRFTKSKKAEKYVNRVMVHVKNLNVADAVRGAINYDSLVLGNDNKINVEYKVKENMDLLVSFSDKNRCYAEKRAFIKAGPGKTEVDMALPLSVADKESTFISIKVVPRGADSARRTAEAIVKRKSEAGDMIFNLYGNNFDGQGHVDPALYAGKNNELVTNWRVARDRGIVVRLVDKEGKVWVATTFSAYAGGEDSSRVQLFIPENTPRGTGYKIIERIVPKGGSWDDKLAEEINDGWGRGLSIK